MGVFFSGTDMDDLKNNAKSHNYYLSVVVNNVLDIIGKIAFLAVSETHVKASYKALDEDGNTYDIQSKDSYISKKEKLVNYDCKMIYEKPLESFPTEFYDNVNKILETKTSTFQYQPLGNYSLKPKTNIWKEDKNTNFSKGPVPPKKIEKPSEKVSTKINPFLYNEYLENEVNNFIIEAFGMQSSKVYIVKDSLTIEDILVSLQEDFEQGLLQEETVVNEFFTYLLDNFEVRFPEDKVPGERVIETFIAILEEYSFEYPFIGEILNRFYY